MECLGMRLTRATSIQPSCVPSCVPSAAHDPVRRGNSAADCGTTASVWACLKCGNIGCGRDDSAHAASHWEKTQHPLVLEIRERYVHW